jgi:hypothetical protein
VNDVFPALIAVDFLVPGGSGCKILQNLGSGTTMAFWVRVRGLDRLLVLALEAFPLLLRCFALHVREVIMAYTT